MKIMIFNILEGGVDEGGSRIEHIIDVIKVENPDFLAIQEANNFEKNDYELLKKIRKETSLPHYAFSQGTLQENDNRYHTVNLSRYPMHEIYTFPDTEFFAAALSVVIDSPLGELALCNVHLNYLFENERSRELESVLKYTSKYNQSIILGDHNALSSSDKYDDLFKAEFMEFDLHRLESINMISKKYVDVALRLKENNTATFPTMDVGHPMNKTPIRIDYIFVSHSLKENIKNYTVIKTPNSEKASDHYPVTLTLE